MINLDHIESLAKAGYRVTPVGEVYSSSGWRGIQVRQLRQELNSHGYPRVSLTIDGKRKTCLVHTLVARTFLSPKPSPNHEVRHLDGNRTNNFVSNLKWGTRKENAADRTKHGNCKAAENGRKSSHKAIGKRKATCKYGHPKTNENIGSVYQCLPCRRENYRARPR